MIGWVRALQVRRVVAGLWGFVLTFNGVALIVQAPGRTRAMGFAALRAEGSFLDHSRPMLAWGLLLLAAGLFLDLGVLTDSAPLARAGLRCTTVAAWLFVMGSAVAAIFDGGSFTALGFGIGAVGAQIIAAWRLDDDWGM